MILTLCLMIVALMLSRYWDALMLCLSHMPSTYVPAGAGLHCELSLVHSNMYA